jgi:hypothetical protein
VNLQTLTFQFWDYHFIYINPLCFISPLSVRLINYHAFRNSALGGGDWSAPRPGWFISYLVWESFVINPLTIECLLQRHMSVFVLWPGIILHQRGWTCFTDETRHEPHVLRRVSHQQKARRSLQCKGNTFKKQRRWSSSILKMGRTDNDYSCLLQAAFVILSVVPDNIVFVCLACASTSLAYVRRVQSKHLLAVNISNRIETCEGDRFEWFLNFLEKHS